FAARARPRRPAPAGHHGPLRPAHAQALRIAAPRALPVPSIEGGARRRERVMTFEDWIFALHLLSAATLVGSLVMSWIVVVSLLSVHTPGETIALSRVAMVGTVTTVVGLIGAIAFGIWLAILRDAFHVWDGWVIAAIVLWVIAAGALWAAFIEAAKAVET